MHIVLANEIADVDLAEFDKIGSFCDGVVAVPLVDVSLGLKGMPTSLADAVDECQNSIILTYDAPESDEQLDVELSGDPFSPGILYRCRRTTRDYAELLYKTHLGALVVYAYFLVGVENCIFGYREKVSLSTARMDYDVLWKKGFITDFSER